MSQPRRLRWRRVCAGYYKAEAQTTLERDGRQQRVMVEVSIRHMPEWSGSEKWCVEVSTVPSEESGTFTLADTSDITATTKGEATEAAAVAVAGGWKWRPGLGYCGQPVL